MSDSSGVTGKAQMRAVFERIAPDYDPAPGCFARFGRRLVEAAELAPNLRVLDVATGRGALLLPAAEAVGPGGMVVGIDLAGAMVRAARDEVARRGLRAAFQIMDAEALAFPDSTFDRVLCGFGLMFFPQIERALAEYRRVLRPGGWLALSTWRVPQTADLEAVLAQLDLPRDANNGILRFAEPEVLAQMLERAGFSAVRARADTILFRYADLDQYWESTRGTGLRRWLDQLDAAQAAAVRAALEAHVAPQRRADGLYLAATAVLAVAER